jgi:putative FmdB family regulatory protein
VPIYAYRCETCGFTKDVLQKLSDSVLQQCPSCHADTFKRQLTAPGFQLKGSGWYATDFKGNNTLTAKPQTSEKSATSSEAASTCSKPACAVAGSCSTPAAE